MEEVIGLGLRFAWGPDFFVLFAGFSWGRARILRYREVWTAAPQLCITVAVIRGEVRHRDQEASLTSLQLPPRRGIRLYFELIVKLVELPKRLPLAFIRQVEAV